MSIVKQWTTAIGASFDWVISQVENHDALVSAAIREMQGAGAKARIQLTRVKQDGERLRQRLLELEEMIPLWNERSARVYAKDKEKALECLKRKHQVEAELKVVKQQLAEHAKAEQQLTKDLHLIEERVQDLRRKKNTMTARQYRAEALKAGQLSELGLIGEIDEVLERWEVKLCQYEGVIAPTDTIAAEFDEAETRQKLEAELEELVKRAV